MSSQSGQFDAASVLISTTPTTFNVNSTSPATTYSTTSSISNVGLSGNGGTVSGGTTLTFTSNSAFTNAAWQTVGNLVVFTPDFGTGGTTNIVTFSNGASTTPIGLIPLPISAFINSSNVSVTLPTSYANGNLNMVAGAPPSYVSVFNSATTPSTTFTGTGFPVFPVGTLITITNATSGTFGNVNRLINRPVLTSTSTQLTISGYVFQNTTFGSATITSPQYGTYSTNVLYAGTGYTTGDTFTFRGTLFGGTSPANDLSVTITAGTVNGLPNAVSSVSLSGTMPTVLPASSVVVLEYPGNRTVRDASEMTTRTKERIAYTEYRTGTTIAGSSKATRLGGTKLNDAGGANQLELRQSNGFRLSYLKGRLNCGACIGGTFNANGPQSGS